jgi:hypothetical protein
LNLSQCHVHGKWPPVTALVVHLLNRPLVYGWENATAEQVQRQMQSNVITLTGFLEYYSTDPAE